MDKSPIRSPAGSPVRPKIAVKDILRSNPGGYTTFPPISRYAQQRAPRQVPFSLSDLSTESSSQRAASFGNLLSSFRYKPESPSHDEEDSSSEPPTPVRESRQRKAKPTSFQTMADYLGDDIGDDEPVERRSARKRKRITLDSDNEEDEEANDNMNEDEEEDDDEEDGGAYIDEDERKDRVRDRLTTSHEGIGILKRLFPRMSDERIREALERAGGSQVLASKILAGNRLGAVIPVVPPRKLQRLRQRQPVSSDEEDESDEDTVDHRALLEEARKMMQAVRFYNKATLQEIQDVNGCSATAAEKLIKLRPFKDIDELKETLQQERGLSPKFVSNYVDIMDGYNVVDQIIESIEEIGTQLQHIIDVWNGQNPESHADDSNNQSENNILEDEGGMHLTGAHIDGVPFDKTNAIYRDAMDGFLTEQPAIINKEITLKNYQLIGINWLLMLYRKGISGILADEMGLGKTAQVISFLGRLHELGNKGPHLIVVPTSTLDNWLREFERFCPTLKVHGYYGTQDERLDMREELMENIDEYNVIVTTYTIATGAKDDRSFLRKLKCKSLILDEGHMIRNCTSARYRHLISLKTPFRLLLTGTPLQNNLQELVSLLIFIMPDMLLENEEEIRKIFKIKAVRTSTDDSDKGSSTAQLLSQKRIARAKKMMTPFVLRRRKADVLKDLPKKIQVIERCPMTPNQQKLYDLILAESKKSYKEALNSKSQAGKKEGSDRFKNIVIQLRKAADHPLLFRHIYDDKILKKMAKAIKKEEQYWDSVEEYIYEDMTVMTDFELDKLCREHKTIKRYALKNQEWMDAGKVEKLKETLATYRKKGSKILLFSQFTRLLDILELVMDTLGYKYLRLDGETKMADRQVLIDQFNEDDTIDVFLLSTKAGGFGINLTSANVVILYDLDFNPQNDRQAEDRAHRVGQTQDVTVIKLIADKSIEEHILSMAEIKLRLDRSVSGLKEGQEESEDDEEQKEKVQSLLKTVLLS